jgi:hypothetical protein
MKKCISFTFRINERKHITSSYTWRINSLPTAVNEARCNSSFNLLGSISSSVFPRISSRQLWLAAPTKSPFFAQLGRISGKTAMLFFGNLYYFLKRRGSYWRFFKLLFSWWLQIYIACTAVLLSTCSRQFYFSWMLTSVSVTRPFKHGNDYCLVV